MELDKRIKDRTGIQTCISFDKKYIGKKGFFFDEFCQLIDLKAKCCYGTLIDINETDVANDLCFKATSDKTGYNCFFRFFIPEDHLKPVEKKYRPYTLAEWIDQHEIGEVIHCRNEHKQEFHVMYTGYVIDNGEEDIQDNRTTGRIMLINMGYLLQELFERYEICVNGEWQPFGVVKND